MPLFGPIHDGTDDPPHPRALPAAPGDEMSDQKIFGWFDDAGQTVPSHDPPHDAPCLFCGRPITPDDVRTHGLMYVEPEYAKRSYFYRTHRTCSETDPTHTACDGIVFDMIEREE